ncbi:MAG: tRNA dihydrouridine(20/20a) synthase DusA [Paracoccaceae bacterium]|jgi:tRNA-dihydrouridine synthase A|tara:strand:- start:2694 stop:3674 length:981 start_codon:yes stop_codon:yes gene_type:complete
MTKFPNIRNYAKLSVAPMMDWTDRHCRYFHRTLSKNVLLYTEMVTSPALIKGNATYLLEFDKSEHPIALQLGGSDPNELAKAAVIGSKYGYDEINLNVGCPSDRVQSGTFGAVLMKTPEVVAKCCKEMIDAVDIEVTVKCRVGVDQQDPNETLPKFLEYISNAGVTRVIIHARKAILSGLSPKQNRNVPPLNYEIVYRMKELFPNLHISLNGGIQSLQEAKVHLDNGIDGIMIGRAAYQKPGEILIDVDNYIFNDKIQTSEKDVVKKMVPYIESQYKNGNKVSKITRHMLGLFSGQPGAKGWRKILSENAHSAGPEVVLRALSEVN